MIKLSMNKIISIIVLTYNAEKDIKDCLNSLLKNFNHQKGEIIVWDNNSQDSTKQILEKYKNFNFIKIIFNEKNDGFALGNNEASKLASGKYLLLLNADTISDFKTYEDLINYIDQNSQVGVVGPKCIDERGVVQESFGADPNILKEIFGKIFMSLYLEKIPVFKNLKNKILFRKEIKMVDWIGGACVLIRKTLWDKIGGLDSKYFFSNADMIDFCSQIRCLGFKCVYYPKASIIHKGSRIVTQDLKTRSEGLKNGYLGSLYLLKKRQKSLLYIYAMKIVYIIISFMKGVISLFLTLFSKKFKDIALSHLNVSFYLCKNFFKNNL